MIKRIGFLFFIASSQFLQAATLKPNIVFLLVDDLGDTSVGRIVTKLEEMGIAEHTVIHRTTPYGAIRDGDWKLIEFFEDGRLELFDLKSDPCERKDLAEAKPEKAAELLAKLRKWRKDVDARMPTPNPRYTPTKDRATGGRKSARK